jgi:hypothetical protein
MFYILKYKHLMFILVSLLFILFGSCKNSKKESKGVEVEVVSDSLIVAGSQFGGIVGTNNIEDLRKKYAIYRIKDDTIWDSEGIGKILVTKIDRNTPQEIVVYWADNKFHQKIGMIQTAQPHSPFKTSQGVCINTSLTELRRINGAPITFSAFDSDSESTDLVSFNGGLLDKLNSPLLIELSLDISDKGNFPRELIEDNTLSSDDSKIKQYFDRIYISSLSVVFK